MANEDSHRVTISDLYRQGEDIQKNLGVMTTQTAILLDRSAERDKLFDKMEVRVSRLEKVVYWAGVPLSLLAGGTLGWDLLKTVI